MAVNTRQHFVSQFTIRAFMGNRNRLFCLDKSTLKVRDRTNGNIPSDILKEAHYYTTDTDDFDGEIVRPCEDSLAPLCAAVVADPDRPLTSADMSLLTDWCSLALTRSTFFAHVTSIAFDRLSETDRADLPSTPKAMTLVARRAVFQHIRQELSKIHLMFRFLKSPKPFGYYLTDYPCAPIPYRRVGVIGPLLLPLSHNLMLVQIPAQLADQFFGRLQPTLEWLTLVQCGWAHRLIYSADLDALDCAAFILSEGRRDQASEMRKRALRPFFGFGAPSELASMWADSTPL